MKGSARRQKCDLTGAPAATSNLKAKCVTVLVYEEEGKTVLQPLATKQETQALQELFQNNTLEVWLSNGKSDVAEFDVSILKYKPQLQPSTRCSRTKTRVCLKNHFDTIASCEQCPISVDGVKD